MRIIILRNQVKNILALEKGISDAVLLCNKIGLFIDTVTQDINKTFNSIAISSDVVSSGFAINPQQILSASSGTADIVCLITPYSKVFPFNFSVVNPINPCTFDLDQTTLNNTIVIGIPEDWYNDYPEVLTQFFLHELCHALYDKTGIRPDLTHSQYSNANYSQKQPTEYYLYLLASLVKPQEPLKAVLTRNSDNGVETVGTLTFGNFVCKTLELPWKNNQPYISCITPGVYNCEYTFSFRMLKFTYELRKVSGRSSIRVHNGNLYSDSNGCILLGDSFSDISGDGQVDVLNSKKTVQAFEILMGKRPFILEIRSNY